MEKRTQPTLAAGRLAGDRLSDVSPPGRPTQRGARLLGGGGEISIVFSEKSIVFRHLGVKIGVQ